MSVGPLVFLNVKLIYCSFTEKILRALKTLLVEFFLPLLIFLTILVGKCDAPTWGACFDLCAHICFENLWILAETCFVLCCWDQSGQSQVIDPPLPRILARNRGGVNHLGVEGSNPGYENVRL